jgi:putative acetyltransferase
MNIRRATSADSQRIIDIWLRCVRATHTFLSEQEIQALLPQVGPELDKCELWVLCSAENCPIGFLGMSPNQIEAMFIAPEFIRRGGGRQLVQHALSLSDGDLTVDVNEQNTPARSFYEACGFVVIGRTEVDTGGRPYPLLHMKLKKSAQR